ncbi:MAG: histidine kinase [Candidatus Riflebacteria bacterium]|nr:histidine kinase [Candidatus Riflebacteria bacterium]
MKDKPEDFLELLQKAKKGQLKVFLGFAAGVGKTYQMLKDAQALKSRGVDVVIGYIETHNRPETAAQIQDLEIVPRQKIEYRGVFIEEMDVDAIIARNPQIAIVDEVAHTNVPGSRNKRRYQDILQILEKGINVICAFNIQHLESLNNLVERTVEIAIRETVPDSIIKQAHQVVTVDLAVEDLLDRLRSGKIYAPEKVEWALSNFFRDEHLSALRELALREVAESLERGNNTFVTKKDSYQPSAKPVRRVMVCIASASPRALVLLRKGSRLAGKLNTHWFAVYVETPQENPMRIDSETQRILMNTLETARELGAEVARLQSSDPVGSLLEFAMSHGVGDIIIGRSNQPWWKQALGLSPVHRLINEAQGFDVHVVSYDEDDRL